MIEIYLYLLITICTGLLGWGLIRRERVYEYPFFMGGIFITFILPQAISLINNPAPVSQKALERVLLMTCLCAAMCWLGYQIPPHSSLVKKLDISVNLRKLFHGGIVFVSISYASAFLISQLPEAIREDSTWTGIVTVYGFFGGLIYPGFTIILLSTLQRPNLTKIILTALSAALPLQTIIFYGRREPTATFILTIGLCLYFWRRYVPHKWVIIVVIAIALLLIPLTAEYRYIAKTGNWSQLLNLRPVENFYRFIEEGEVLELKNAALLMDASVQTNQYGYGTEYWNKFVFRFVPAQFIGRDLKNALQIKLPNYNLETLYNYSIPTGSTTTGIADAFVQFDYFGSLFFLLLGYLFKHLWVSAIYRHSIVSQLFYVSLVAPAMISVTHETVRFPPDLFFYYVFLGALIIYSRQKPTSEIKGGPQFYV